MRFHLAPELVDRLRSAQSNLGYPPNQHQQLRGAFLLDPGLGPAAYLTTDGRVLVDHSGWGEDKIEEAQSLDAIAYLVIGSENLGVSELLELLPNRPDAIPECKTCNGLRWQNIDNPSKIVCQDCSGLGWLGSIP